MQDGANMAFNVTGINSISPGHWEFQSSWNQFCTSSLEHIVDNNVCTVWFLSLWTQSQSLEILPEGCNQVCTANFQVLQRNPSHKFPSVLYFWNPTKWFSMWLQIDYILKFCHNALRRVPVVWHNLKGSPVPVSKISFTSCLEKFQVL